MTIQQKSCIEFMYWSIIWKYTHMKIQVVKIWLKNKTETTDKNIVISRIENKENSPTLKTLCSILDVLGYEIRFEPKQRV